MLYGDTISALKDLLKRLLQRNLTPHGLQDMFAVGAAWLWWRKKQGNRGACLLTRGHEAETALDAEQDLVRPVLTSPCDVRSDVTLV